jgi:hypothetical protein
LFRRALDFARRPFGFWRTHSSSCAIVSGARLLALLLREPGLLLLEPARVVALERDALAAVELEDPARDVVEEVAIVGHRHDGALVLLEVALEPRDRLGVEVVGGLVEQQQVGRGEQQPAERDAAALAAGELRHVGVAGGRRSASIAWSSWRVEVPGVGRRRCGPAGARTRPRSRRSSSRRAR